MTAIKPADAAKLMREIEHGPAAWHNERGHMNADELLVKVLRSLGYGELCDSYGRIEKWYA